MKRFSQFWPAVLLAISLLFMPALASAGYFWLGVVDELGDPIASGVKCRVITADTPSTNATIYSDAAYGTSATNPISADSSGKCAWYSSTTSFDVIVYHQRGVARLASWTVNDHRVIIDKMSPFKHILFPFSAAGGTTETSSGIDLPEGALVLDAIVEVTTAGTTQPANTVGISPGVAPYINVGLLTTQSGGSAGGFIASLPASGTGFFRPTVVFRAFTTDAARGWIASSQRGGFLATWKLGQLDTSTNLSTTPGIYAEQPYIIQSGKATTITYSTGGHASFAGYVHIWYTEIANR